MEVKTMNSESMGRSNRLAILNLIRKYPGVSRRELVEMTGLNPSTVTNIVFDLIERKFVEEGGKGTGSGPGRKTIDLFPSKDAATAIIAKIGVETTQIGLGYLDNGFENVCDFETPESSERFFELFSDKIYEFYEKESMRENVIGLSISAPGIVDKDKVEMEILPHLGWKRIEIGKALNEKNEGFNLPILLENEAKLSLMAEMYYNEKLDNLKNGLYIYISQGVGGALLINGQIFQGNSFTAGEVGHMSIYADGPTCHCGNKGCWEEYISIDTIVKKYESSGKKLEGSNFKDKFQNLIFKSEKDDNAKKVLLEMMSYLSIGITSLVNILNPKFVMIGGMGEKIPNKYLKIVEETVRESALESATKDLSIMTSSMDMIQSALMGCTLMAMDEFSRRAIG
uniref:ROK family transcriptional regulator n=1 Tax=Mesoaciditoga lauensis TaxID=1495039 RepID=A0A7V3RF54_9BACT